MLLQVHTLIVTRIQSISFLTWSTKHSRKLSGGVSLLYRFRWSHITPMFTLSAVNKITPTAISISRLIDTDLILMTFIVFLFLKVSYHNFILDHLWVIMMRNTLWHSFRSLLCFIICFCSCVQPTLVRECFYWFHIIHHQYFVSINRYSLSWIEFGGSIMKLILNFSY